MAERYRTSVDPSAANNPHSFALELVGTDQRVLEIGCSTGHVTRHLVAAGNTVVGVELDEAAAVDARDVTDVVHVVDLDVTLVSSVESGRFDVILLGDVLEHVRDPNAVLADIVTLLAPKGRLVVSVPNAAHVDVRLMLLEGRIEYQHDGLLDRTHLRWFTKESFRQLLDDCGFVATELRRVIFPVGGSNVPFDLEVHSQATLDFISADPEWLSYQFVVECKRRDEVGEVPDALAPLTHQWPAHDCEANNAEHNALVDRVADLEGRLAAWEGSRIARWSLPVRAVSARIQRRVAGARDRASSAGHKP